jgi:hypothetical protein
MSRHSAGLPEAETSFAGFVLAGTPRKTEALPFWDAVSKSRARRKARYSVSLVYFALGDNNVGFEWLTRAFDRRQIDVSSAKFDPALDNIRSDLRLQRLL